MQQQYRPSSRVYKVDNFVLGTPLSRSQKVNFVFFLYSISFLFSFDLFFTFSIFRTQGQGQITRCREQMMSYNMNTTCQPYVLYMVVQGRWHSSEHRPLVVVYKVDQFVERSLSSSLVLPNTRLLSNPTLRVLSYNIRTRSPIQNRSTLSPFSYSLIILDQEITLSLSQEAITRSQA